MATPTTIDPYLEREYDVRKLRDDFDDIVLGWSNRSKALREGVACELDLAYGAESRQTLDIFYCGTAKAPLLTFIHGGYWQRGAKSVYSFMSEPFLDKGCDVCVINYTLCPETNIPGITSEIRRAIAWLWLNAASVKINRDAIHVSGHSAGGHLTAMMLATRWSAFDSGLPDDLICSGLPLSGLYDLDPLRATSINNALGIDDETTRTHSPMWLQPETSAPAFVILGNAETTEFHKQSEAFHQAWRGTGLAMDYYAEPDVDHFDLLNRLADPGSVLFHRVCKWIQQTSKG